MTKEETDIPEEIREFVEKAHKAIRESRPDEGWRIQPMQKAESIAPYKADDESMDAETDETPGFAQGGAIPGFDDGGAIPDPNADLADIAKLGGMMPGAPLPAAQPPDPAPIDTPKAPAVVPAQPPKPDIGAPAAPAAPPMTDASYIDRANNMLGLKPDEQSAFLKMLGQKSQAGQIGAGIAGIGDAIASGSTLGKVNPGGLQRSEDILQNKTKEGIEGMQTLRGNNEKAQELSDKLQARDPQSPLSKWAQKAYGPVGKKIGLNLNNASASLIGDVTGKGVEALNTEYQDQLKLMGLDLQKKQVDATIGNQKAERDIAREGHQAEAAKTLADRGIFKTLANAIPGTSGHAATKILEKQAEGVAPDVQAYADKHGITVEQAQAIKDKRTGGK